MNPTSAVDRQRGHPGIVLSVVLLCSLAVSGGGCQMFEPAWSTEPVAPIQFPSTQDVKPPEPTPPQDVTPPEPPPSPEPEPPEHDPAAAEAFRELLGHADEKVASAKDFHCRLLRVEVVDDVLRPAEEIEYDQRFEPHSLKLEWVGERSQGRKVIYVAGANDDKVLVQTGGWSGRILTRLKKTLRFDLTSKIVKSQGRHTPDVAGYNSLLKRMVSIYDEASEAGHIRMTALDPVEKDGRKLRQFEMTLDPVPADEDVSKMVVWFDLDSSLPAHTILYDGSGRMVEDYDWRNIKLDVGLKDDDFTFENE